ncbi:MAG: hypothetical protein D4R73_08675 [Deltaproteobacteria bacterium]|jgi:hypothetical protein|nr:hypothetical protein [Deltaproteobacteria bacterium]TSA08354.1 MAG: hypothetical protein D4R73_08675 [Deltaproteobacteria bacterium]
MSEKPLDEIISGMSIDQVKDLIVSLMEQIFPVLDEQAQKDFVLKMVGKAGDEETSSMVHL